VFAADFLVKYDQSGSIEWARSHGSSCSNNVLSIALDRLGNIYEAGQISNCSDHKLNMSLFCYDNLGNLIKEKFSTGSLSFGTAIATDGEDNIYVTGSVQIDSIGLPPHVLRTFGQSDWFLAKLSPFEQNSTEPPSPQQQSSSVQEDDIFFYPNPSSGIFTLELTQYKTQTTICIHDVLGNCILNKTILNRREEIDLRTQAKGIYFIEVLSVEKRVVKKVVVQ
jgi:hypothetical protein